MKRFCRAKQKQWFGEKVQDESGLQFTNVELVTGGQEIKLSILVKF